MPGHRRVRQLGRDEIDAAISRVRVCPCEGEALEGARFVTEAVSEELDIKQRLFARAAEEASGRDSRTAPRDTARSGFALRVACRAQRFPGRRFAFHSKGLCNPLHVLARVRQAFGGQVPASEARSEAPRGEPSREPNEGDVRQLRWRTPKQS